MAKGQQATKNIIINNKPSTQISKVVELVVVNGMLVPDENEINPGVNSKDRK